MPHTKRKFSQGPANGTEERLEAIYDLLHDRLPTRIQDMPLNTENVDKVIHEFADLKANGPAPSLIKDVVVLTPPSQPQPQPQPQTAQQPQPRYKNKDFKPGRK